jgi:hypothetical protein
MSDNGGNDATGSSEFNAAPGTNKVTKLETGDVTSLESSNLPEPVDAPVPLEKFLECIPFFAKDYANFNQFLRVSDEDVKTQLQDLYNASSLCIVTFSIFNSSQPSDETMVNGLQIVPSSDYNTKSGISKIKKNIGDESISNYELFRQGFLKIATTQTSGIDESKDLRLTIKAKEVINKKPKIDDQFGGALELPSSESSVSFVDIGDTPDKGSMLFFTDKGKAAVNQKAVDQGVNKPYTNVTAAGALTEEVVIKTPGRTGEESSSKTKFVSQDVKQQIEEDVKQYYAELDKYESAEIDRFLQNPIGYTPSEPPTKPESLGAYLEVNPDKRDDIIQKLFKTLLKDESDVEKHHMMLAVISVDSEREVPVLKVYYYNDNGKFYSIFWQDHNINLGNKGTLHGFAEYMKNNPDLTFLFIKKNNPADYSECAIGRCFYLSGPLQKLHKILLEKYSTTQLSVTQIQSEIQQLESTLRQKQNEYDSRHNKYNTIERNLSKRAEYQNYADSLRNENLNITGQLTNKTDSLSRQNKDLQSFNKKLNDKIGVSKLLYNGSNGEYEPQFYNGISVNFSLDSVVKFCQPSSGAIAAAGGGGNRNNLRVSKLKKILTKKSRKRPTKKSRKRPTKKSRKRPTKKSRKRPTKKSRKRPTKKSRKH